MVPPTEVDASWPNPQISDRKTEAGTFRFYAMPAHLVDERSGVLEDIRDGRFDYPRATPEKALLDWIYLGASARSRLTLPAPDLDTKGLTPEPGRSEVLQISRDLPAPAFGHRHFFPNRRGAGPVGLALSAFDNAVAAAESRSTADLYAALSSRRSTDNTITMSLSSSTS
jgi:hypothetical protein